MQSSQKAPGLAPGNKATISSGIVIVDPET